MRRDSSFCTNLSYIILLRTAPHRGVLLSLSRVIDAGSFGDIQAKAADKQHGLAFDRNWFCVRCV